ncbi:MAG TPA: ATP-binding cassette domain-containing protein [Gaiellaceae bacterium]|nr:ATP-binding cassette domain-containing protein [Gaiellaceae bacterium]
MTLAVEARDVFRVYETREGKAAALQGLSLEIAEGEIVVVFGPSGSGKTTLLRIIAALDAPSAGLVRVHGVDLRRLRGRARDRFRAGAIGYVDQHYSRLLAPELTARRIVELPLALRGDAPTVRRARAGELLERVGLTDRADSYPAELSGGEQQRVALCAAIVHRPKLLLADEPTGELDAATAQGVYTLVRDLAREQGATVLLVSHDIGSAAIADRMVQVRDGRVSAEGAPGEEALVVASTGWVRLPEELLAHSGIGSRARPELAGSSISLSPAKAARRAPVEAQQPRERSRGRASGPAAELRSVSRRFPAGAAVEGLSGAFQAGRLTAITGPSGSGKTTVLHLLAGLDLPTEGEVIVLGHLLSGLSRSERAALRRRELAVIAQDAPLVPFLSARENVELGLQLRAAGGTGLGALTSVGLGELAEQRVDRLSMGEQQRVAIARALAAEPALLLADEPSARLDEANAVAVGDLLARIVDELETTVVFSTHDPVLLEVADEVVDLG